jgi:hypothetical protein
MRSAWLHKRSTLPAGCGGGVLDKSDHECDRIVGGQLVIAGERAPGGEGEGVADRGAGAVGCGSAQAAACDQDVLDGAQVVVEVAQQAPHDRDDRLVA